MSKLSDGMDGCVVRHTKQRPGRLEYRVIRLCISPPPWPIFHARYLHSWNSVGAQEAGVGNVSPRREFRRRTYRSLLSPSWLSSNRAWKTVPGGGVIYTVLCGRVNRKCTTRSQAASSYLQSLARSLDAFVAIYRVIAIPAPPKVMRPVF